MEKIKENEVFTKTKRLFFKLKKKVNQTFLGNYKSAFQGEGLDYKTSNIFQFGDSIKNIDWKTTAKTGKVFVKKFEEERKLKVYFLIDTNITLKTGFSELKTEKLIESLSILMFSSFLNGDNFSTIFLGNSKNNLNLKTGKNHFKNCLLHLFKENFDNKNINYEKEFSSFNSNKNGIYFLFSDFENEKIIKEYKKIQGKEKYSIFLRDNLEKIGTNKGISEIINPENGESIEIDWEKFKTAKKELNTIFIQKRNNFLFSGIKSIEVFDTKDCFDVFFKFFKQKS